MFVDQRVQPGLFVKNKTGVGLKCDFTAAKQMQGACGCIGT